VKLTLLIRGGHGLIASALDRRVIWNIFSGTIHRILHFEESIVAVAFDEELGIWATTASRRHFLSVNGKALAKISVTEKLIVIVLLPVDSPRRLQAVILGTSSGSLFALELKFGRGIIDLKRLPSQHKDPTENTVAHPVILRQHPRQIYVDLSISVCRTRNFATLATAGLSFLTALGSNKSKHISKIETHHPTRARVNV
jgi:hypothetical protein